ncbi:MAG: hypothetical protein Q7J06_08390 [Bacteroidales bacterium]|nr:hypothetical protein [Bacteroidales bacterium]
MRIPFSAIFIRHQDGSLEPLRRVRIGGVEFGPGVKLSGGVRFGGVDITKYIGRDLEIEVDNDTWIVTGIY